MMRHSYKEINPADLVPMDIFVEREPIKIDMVYQQPNHSRNIFESQIYRDGARLWLHKDLAKIVVLASRILLWHSVQIRQEILYLQLKDGLRTTDAQAAMWETDIAKANPQWLEDGPNRLLSPPGAGAHPRGMAIDAAIITRNGAYIDMGTEFDDLSEKSARGYENLPDHILANRALLEKSIMEASILEDEMMHPLPCEWWDFRFLGDFYAPFTPLNDADLPPQMQMTNNIKNGIPDFPESHFETLAEDITSAINQHNDYL